MARDKDLVRSLAVCAGRMAATSDFHNITHPSYDGVVTVDDRRAMNQILTALSDQSLGPQIYVWRRNGRSAQARLLTRSLFASDPNDAAWSSQQADTQLQGCLDFIHH